MRAGEDGLGRAVYVSVIRFGRVAEILEGGTLFLKRLDDVAERLFSRLDNAEILHLMDGGLEGTSLI